MKKRIPDLLRSVGYYSRKPEEIAVAGALAQLQRNGSGLVALLLEGPPGCGKTQLAESLAQALGSTVVFGQLHSWSDDQELFAGIDIAAAVGGDVNNVRQLGLLALAAAKSQEATIETPVILILDEVDKTSERTECLLLDFLQSGRVPVAPGKHLQANRCGLIVFMTSNNQRPLGDAILRRVRRVTMAPLPVEKVDELVSKQTGVSTTLARLVRKAAYRVAEADQAHLSLQEIVNLVHEILETAEDVDDIRQSLAGWASRGDTSRHVALTFKNSALWLDAIWSQISSSRRV